MSPKELTPKLGINSFSCPHCGALSHQHWFRIFIAGYDKGKSPFVLDNVILQSNGAKGMDEEDVKRLKQFAARFKRNEVTYESRRYGQDCHSEMANVSMSMCHSCDGFAVWIKGEIAWPAYALEIVPHEDMPEDVKADFIEAASIIDKSPRGAAALTRLALQKLMVDLGEKGKNINEDIASLVSKGLEQEIQQALDVVRVVGNNAVHPGTVDLKDDKGTAVALLQLVNLVVDRRISAQKRIQEMFSNLPTSALEQIKKRDAKATGP